MGTFVKTAGFTGKSARALSMAMGTPNWRESNCTAFENRVAPAWKGTGPRVPEVFGSTTFTRCSNSASCSVESSSLITSERRVP